MSKTPIMSGDEGPAIGCADVSCRQAALTSSAFGS